MVKRKRKSASVAHPTYTLSVHERQVIEGILEKIETPRNTNKEFSDNRSLGEKASDTIAMFGGSWTFIIGFMIFLLCWAFLNTEILGARHDAFDPYPYVFLNLILSMLAALQAPIIMMSQNRQSARDRLDAEIDHEVNVEAHLAISLVLNKIDQIEKKLDEINERVNQVKP